MELRKWFSHEPSKWAEFRRRYAEELKGKEAILTDLRALGRRRTVTLIYAARDEEHNQTVALREYLGRR